MPRIYWSADAQVHREVGVMLCSAEGRDALINNGLLMIMITESFEECLRLSSGEVLSASLINMDLTWQLLSSQMLQKYGFQQPLKSVIEHNTESAFVAKLKKERKKTGNKIDLGQVL